MYSQEYICRPIEPQVSMTKITNKQIEELIESIAGGDGVLIYKVLKGRENVDEFFIAEKLKMTINQVRNILYKFELKNLIDSDRKKDKKKGWYVYFFTFKPYEAEYLVMEEKRQILNRLKKKVEGENTTDFLECTNKCIRMDSKEALEHNYMCPECGQLLIHENGKSMKKMENRIEELEKEINELDGDLKKRRSMAAKEAEDAEKRELARKKKSGSKPAKKIQKKKAVKAGSKEK